MTDGALPKVLYIVAGNPARPTTGMDVVAREHLKELLSATELSVHGIVVRGVSSKTSAPDWGTSVSTYVGDHPGAEPSAGINEGKLRYLSRGRILMLIGFASTAARQRIARELRASPDVVVIDHVIAMANVSLVDLFRYKGPVIFVSHNRQMHSMRDQARFGRTWYMRGGKWLQALQMGMLEVTLMQRSALTIFLSEFDRAHSLASKWRRTVAMCPGLARPKNDPSRAMLGRRVLFIGSPDFPPNAFALEWLTRRLAPELTRLSANVEILLVGRGTEQFSDDALGVRGLGFVHDDDVAKLLSECVCLVSPVIHGSGIKIKILEALAANCPVFATCESLRGFEFMGIDARIEIDEPAATARRLLELADRPDEQLRERRQMAKAWDDHLAARQHQLSNAVAAFARERRGIGEHV
jgi:glycosyltransferase involved in cell wall biosynthesis